MNPPVEVILGKQSSTCISKMQVQGPQKLRGMTNVDNARVEPIASTVSYGVSCFDKNESMIFVHKANITVHGCC
jgi:hypothetical protein